MSEVKYAIDRENNLATLTIDTAGPVNLIDRSFLTQLEKVAARAVADEIEGLMLTSSKAKSFLDGANLQELATGASAQGIRHTLLRYQDVLAALAKAPFPIVALLDGQTALGGGFEMLLFAADHVFAAPGSKMGLPEVNVGLFPAGGGTQTLKRVVGFQTAVQMITTGRVSPAESFADTAPVTVCPSEKLRTAATNWLRNNRKIVNRNYDPEFKDPVPLSVEEEQTIITKAKARYGICPHRPYLAAAIEALEAGLELTFEDAVQKEIDLLGPLFSNTNVRNKIDLFFLTTKFSTKLLKVDARKAIPVKKIGVIGAGLMGRGVAQVAADKGMSVTLIDVDANRAKSARDDIEGTLDRLVAKGRWPSARKEAAMANLSWTTDYADLGDAELIIECVFEDLPLKHKILSQVQEVNPDAIFASNTSSIPMAEIAAGASRPEQVVGMHYFSPVPLMPLLEVVEGQHSSPAAVATAVTCGRAMGKTVILVGDGPGFYTSRTFGSYVMNGFKLVELGVSPWDVDRLALQAGFPQGPLHVWGTAGGNVIYHAGKFMADRFQNRTLLPESLTRVYKAGYVGAGAPSFYTDDKKMTRDETVLKHLVRAEGLPTPTEEEVVDFLLLGMVNEAFWCLSDGVLRDYFSMELGAALGIGFPDCWHGPGRYVSLKGVRAVRARLAELSEKFEAPGLKPAPEFSQLIACGLDSSLV